VFINKMHFKRTMAF